MRYSILCGHTIPVGTNPIWLQDYETEKGAWMVIEERGSMTTPIRNKLRRNAASAHTLIRKLFNSFIPTSYSINQNMTQRLVFTYLDYIENIICPLRIKILGLVRLSYSLSLMVQFTFFTFGNIEKKTKMLSADVQKNVLRNLTLFWFLALSLLCVAHLLLIAWLYHPRSWYCTSVMLLPIYMHM